MYNRFLFARLRLIIVVRQQAQISNRLVALSALIGHCIHHKISILIFSLNEYKDQFEPQLDNSLVRVVFLPSLLHRLFVRLLNSRPMRLIYSRSPWLQALDNQRAWSEIDPSRLRSQLWLINGSGDWCRNMPAVEAVDAEQIRLALSFRSEWQHQAKTISAELRVNYDALVGIHARRGDYASHRGGRWFYDELDYLRWIKQVPNLFPTLQPERIRFVVCSNEPDFLVDTIGDSVAVSPMGSAAGDQLLLSTCDLIIGPPSTFSVWAAFLSDTHLLHISSRDQQLQSSQIRRSTLFYDWRPQTEAQA